MVLIFLFVCYLASAEMIHKRNVGNGIQGHGHCMVMLVGHLILDIILLIFLPFPFFSFYWFVLIPLWN